MKGNSEDALDHAIIQEAKEHGEFVNWDDAKKSLDKKHQVNGIQNTRRKTGIKVSAKSTQKRLR